MKINNLASMCYNLPFTLAQKQAEGHLQSRTLKERRVFKTVKADRPIARYTRGYLLLPG